MLNGWAYYCFVEIPYGAFLNGVEIDKYANVRFLLSYDRDFFTKCSKKYVFCSIS